jgi:hypothetical protein
LEFNLSNNITVTNQQSTIVTITTTGPQGPIGPIGNSGSDGAPGSDGASGIFNQTGSFYNTTNNVGITGSFVVTGGITGSNSISAIYDLFGVTRSLAEQGGDVIKWDPSLQKYTNGPLVLFSGFNVSSSDPTGVVGFESLTLTNDDTINFIGASGSKNGSVLDIKFDTGFDRIDGQRVQANRVIRYMSGSLNPPSIKASPDQVSLTVTSEEYQIASASVKYGLPAINVNSNGKRFTFYQLMDGESIQITQSATATGLIETVGKYKIDVFICNTTPSYYLITSESLSVF